MQKCFYGLKMDKVASCHTALPSVSVIIPSGDSHATIAAAIDSVLSQSYPSIEIIVVLNGNTGTTPDVIRRYTSISVFTLPDGNGYEARSYGASKAHGEYLISLDADDCLHPNAIAEAVKTARDNSADIVQLRLVQFARKAGINILWKFPCLYDSDNALKGILSDSTVYNPGIPAKLYRRSLVVPFPDIGYKGFWGEDRLFSMHIFSKNPKTAYAPDAVYYYRYGGRSRDMTRKGLSDEMLQIRDLQIKYLRDNKLEQYIPSVKEGYRHLLDIIARYKSPDMFLRLKLLISKLLS